MRKLLLLSLLAITFPNLVSVALAQQNTSGTEKFNYQSTRIGTFSDGVFVYKNDDTAVSGKFLEGNETGCFVCTSGETVNLNTLFYATPFLAGHPGLVIGTLYKSVYFSGYTRLDGGNYVLPYRWTRGRFTITRPATLTGQLNFHSEFFPYINPTIPFYSKQLSLQGTVIVSLEMFKIVQSKNGESVVPAFRILDVKYDFSNSPQLSEVNVEDSTQ